MEYVQILLSSGTVKTLDLHECLWTSLNKRLHFLPRTARNLYVFGSTAVAQWVSESKFSASSLMRIDAVFLDPEPLEEMSTSMFAALYDCT